jgi:HEAT repeat protein
MSDDKYASARPFDVLNPRGLAGKREYVRSLEQRSDAEALSLLVECLCDESWFLRDLAEEALLRLGERGAPVLVPLLGQGLWFSRTSAARVLGRAAHRPAVPPLLRLADDANATVAEAARDALAEIGRGGGAISLARGLASLTPELRRRRAEEIRMKDRHLMERIERLMQHDELMTVDDDSLSDESPMVRATEEGLEWEVLTGPVTSPSPSHRPGAQGPRGESGSD